MPKCAFLGYLAKDARSLPAGRSLIGSPRCADDGCRAAAGVSATVPQTSSGTCPSLCRARPTPQAGEQDRGAEGARAQAPGGAHQAAGDEFRDPGLPDTVRAGGEALEERQPHDNQPQRVDQAETGVSRGEEPNPAATKSARGRLSGS